VAIDFNGVGQYVLDSAHVHYMLLVGGDLILATYAGTGSPAGVLTVTKHDIVARKIEGTLSFTTKPTSPDSPFGTNPKFESGSFKVWYPEP